MMYEMLKRLLWYIKLYSRDEMAKYYYISCVFMMNAMETNGTGIVGILIYLEGQCNTPHH